MDNEKLIAVAVIAGIVIVAFAAFFSGKTVQQSEEEKPGQEVQPPAGENKGTEGTTGEGGGGQTTQTENLVEITSDGTFSPREITISVGEKVYFLNNDDVKHTVLIPSRAWEQELEPDEQTERPPKYYEAQKGSNTFKLKDNPDVTGTVIVE